jgi:hypothetical protein
MKCDTMASCKVLTDKPDRLASCASRKATASRSVCRSVFIFVSGFMGLPFGCELRDLHFALTGSPAITPTRRLQSRCAVRGDSLLFTLAKRGQARGNLGAGAVGGFYALHGRSVSNFGRFGCNNNAGVS